jgi:hypothetical protein
VDGGIFGRDCIIDTQLGRVLRHEDGQQKWVKTGEKFWISRPAG